jgi:hypothetical protein
MRQKLKPFFLGPSQANRQVSLLHGDASRVPELLDELIDLADCVAGLTDGS